MSRQYAIGELLSLRASPLICKPAGLLPKEEWMGQVAVDPMTSEDLANILASPLSQDLIQRKQANRSKPEDSFQYDNSLNRRAPIEAKSIRRGSVSGKLGSIAYLHSAPTDKYIYSP